MPQVFDTARAEKNRAAKIRRELAKLDYSLRKCRRHGGYGVLDLDVNFIVFGISADGRGCDATLDDVEAWLAAP